MAGWVKIHRDICDHWLWGSESFTKAQAWVDLILQANHQPGRVQIKGQVVELERGQQARSEVTLSKTWGWSRDKTRRFLSLLEKDGMIRQQKSQLTSIISICNYDSFQDNKTAGDTADKTAGDTADKTAGDTANDTAGKTQTRSIKKGRSEEVKNINGSRKPLDFAAWPQMPSDQVLSDWKKLRANKKAPVSQTVINRMAGELHTLNNSGIGVDNALAICCERGWQGLKAEWIFNHLSTQGVSYGQGGQNNRSLSAVERVRVANGMDPETGDFLDGDWLGPAPRFKDVN